MKATQKCSKGGLDQATTNFLNQHLSAFSMNDSKPNLRKTLELLQNHFNSHKGNMNLKHSGLLFTSGTTLMQQTDDSLPITKSFSLH
jgi:hypothetical protein